MKRYFDDFKMATSKEMPIVRVYLLLCVLGFFLGVLGIILLRNDFSEQIHFVFDQRMDCSFFDLFFHRNFIVFLLFVSGFALLGVLFSVFFPLYNGFSLGVLIALAALCFGFRGFLIAFLCFAVPYILSVFGNYFLCLSSVRLSVILLDSLRGRGKHCGSARYLYSHLRIYLLTFPVVLLVSLWEWKVVPIFLNFL